MAEDVARENDQEKLIVTVMLDDTLLFDYEYDLTSALNQIFERFKEDSYKIEYDYDSDGVINYLRFTCIPKEEKVENEVDTTVYEESMQTE